jgi:hypothetical protein
MLRTAVLGRVGGGGAIDYNDLTSLKASGSLPLSGDLGLGDGYLRVWAECDLDGEHAEVALGTFVASAPSLVYSGRRGAEGEVLAEGEAELHSLLLLLSQQAFGSPHTVPAGTGAVAHAKGLAESVGLVVDAAPSASALAAPAVFDAGVSCLEAVNWLLAYAGFDGAGVDGMGRVRLVPYTDPAGLAPSVTLTDGEGCVFAPEVPWELDTFEVPNRVVAVCDGPEAAMSAVAENHGDNRYSVEAQGRTVTHVERVTQTESQAALRALAERVLSEKTSAVESVEVTHPWLPLSMGDAARLVYGRAGLDLTGVAASQTLSLVPGMPCKTRFRRFVRR